MTKIIVRGTRSAFLNSARESLTRQSRKALNKKLATLFARAGAECRGKGWDQAQRVAYAKGVGAAAKVVAKLAR